MHMTYGKFQSERNEANEKERLLPEFVFILLSSIFSVVAAVSSQIWSYDGSPCRKHH